MIKTLYISILLALFVTACSPCKNVGSVVTTIKDSTVVKTEIKYKDTTVYTPVDSASIMAMVKCPPSGVINTPVFTQKSKQATVVAQILNNILVAKCKCDSLEILLQQKETIISSYRLQAMTRAEVKVVREKYVPLWVKILAWIGAILSLSGIGIISIKFLKPL